MNTIKRIIASDLEQQEENEVNALIPEISLRDVPEKVQGTDFRSLVISKINETHERLEITVNEQ